MGRVAFLCATFLLAPTLALAFCSDWEITSYQNEVESYLTKLRTYANEAVDAANEAITFAEDAKAYAKCESQNVIAELN